MQSNEKEQELESSSLKGCWIPIKIYQCPELGHGEKLLLGQIYNLDNRGGCVATNQYLGDAMGISVRMVERLLKSLREDGFINILSGPRRRIFVTTKVDSIPSKMTPVNFDPSKMREYPVKNDGSEPSKMTGVTVKFDTHIVKNNILIEQDNKPAEPATLFPLPPIIATVPDKKPEPVDGQFERVWEKFERHGSKKKALTYWKKLTPDQRNEVEKNTTAYVASTPGGKFRKYLEGWINPANELWRRPVSNHNNTHTATGQLKQGQTNERGYTISYK